MPFSAAAETKSQGSVVNSSPCQRESRKSAYPLVYRISCADSASERNRQHPTFLFEDDPLTAAPVEGRRSSHLSGNNPIYQLRDYVRQFQQASFVIIKTRNCRRGLGLSIFDRDRRETMLILDHDLQRAIEKVATCRIDRTTDSNEGHLEMSAPYRFLWHHREPLQQHAQSAPAFLRSMIEAIIAYVETSYGPEYAEASELMSRGKITHHHLDKLFRPNQLITSDICWNNASKGKAVAVLETWPHMEGKKLLLNAWHWEYNGWQCYRKIRTWALGAPVEDMNEPFDIVKFPWHPVTYISEEDIKLIRKRGEMFWSLLEPKFVFCHNKNYTQGFSCVRPGRYMIDFDMHLELHGAQETHPNDRWNKKTDPWRLELYPNAKPTEDEFLMMPATVPGYDFLEKEWVRLPVSNIEPIQWNKQPFEDLVLAEDVKHLVKALVTVRASTIKTKRQQNKEFGSEFDIISGKGNGLIMLFHGGPGTGKTLTAESVAEMAEMPLYPITCGDIGTEPEKVEEYLRTVFMLGKRWNCVLLLDEADVFLEERALTDLQRNSLVSVFLRMLEYYEGILILTSNRVGTFDEAFRSRIHIALHYEDLKPRARKQIWINLLSRLDGTDEGKNVDEIKDRVDELARHNLNGREIRNTLAIARQLASYEGVEMTWQHLELAIKTANDFGRYLRDVHGHSDREWAREARTR